MLCSPFLYLLFRRLGRYGLFLLALCYVSGVFINIPGFSTVAFFFFGMGAFFRLYDMDITQITYNYRKIIYVQAITLLLVCTIVDGHNTHIGNIVYPFYIIIGFFALMNLATYIVEKRRSPVIPLLSKGSFFIYLSHKVLVVPITMKIVGSRLLGSQLLAYFVVPVFSIAICLLVYICFNKLMPHLCAVLTGNR